MDWGDGSKLDFYKNSDAIYYPEMNVYNHETFIPVEHTYAKKGIYRATISGVCDVLYGWQSGGSKWWWNDYSPSLKETLVAIIVPKDSTSPLKYAHGSFYNCTNFCYFGYGVLHNATTAGSMPRLFYNTQLKYLNKWFFRNCFGLETIENGFVNTPIVSIPEEFFKYTTKLDWINSAFKNCLNLIELPSDMFETCSDLRVIDDVFAGCENLKTVPENLFDGCQNISKANRTFQNCINITSNIPPLWNRSSDIQHNSYAKKCEKAANYNEAVIAGWT